MKISFEISSLISEQQTGIKRYIYQLIPEIFNRIGPSNRITMLYELSRLKYFRHWWKFRNGRTKVYYHSFWPIIKTHDILHGMDGFVPNWKKTKKIVTTHDLAAIKFNSNDIVSEEFRAKRFSLYKKVRQYADTIITISETTKNDVVNILDISPDRICVTHLGVDKRFFPQDKHIIDNIRKKYSLHNEYLLFVGSISGRKNTERLVEAFARSKASKIFDIVLAGKISYQGEKTQEAIRKHRLVNKAVILHYVVDQDLPAIYSGAKGFVFPTLYEGFGLPILEAMACGVPVLTSNTGSAPEISDQWAINVDPYDIENIADGIDSLLNVSEDHIKKAIEHATKFTWDNCAKNTLSAYSHMLQYQ